MSTRGRSISPRPLHDGDVDMENGNGNGVDKPDAKVVVVTNLTRNVVESHLQSIFGFYGEIVKVDLPVFGKSGQNRGKAAIEYVDPAFAQKAISHMNGGQLDGAILKVELSELPVHHVRYHVHYPAHAPARVRPLEVTLAEHPAILTVTAAAVVSCTKRGPPAPKEKVTELRAWWHRPQGTPFPLKELFCPLQSLAHQIPHTSIPNSFPLIVILVVLKIFPEPKSFTVSKSGEEELES
ncbi:hypothetical protein CERSUDRAFT_91564 [Gelatoporia subvermispora B]|uniref:RRM domain-containing protein n=1 Tax=Ceriporiopsis subvermispora (strain B) TaxID=914234 RepID=M2PVM1_CERS8|nr:hypothetical protein CERSUDRAFT_91564 [Gelatoporia subvermispora B]